jgi:hypothetical protein
MVKSLQNSIYKFCNLHIKHSNNGYELHVFTFKHGKNVWHTSEFVKIKVGNIDDNRTREYKSNKRAKEKFSVYVYSKDRSAT